MKYTYYLIKITQYEAFHRNTKHRNKRPVSLRMRLSTNILFKIILFLFESFPTGICFIFTCLSHFGIITFTHRKSFSLIRQTPASLLRLTERMNIKVALINPTIKELQASEVPLHLGYIAGHLEQNGIEVIIIDQAAGDDVEREIDSYRPDIIGISSMSAMIGEAYRIADMCRNRGILTVMGGEHASALPEEAQEHADVVVAGEGEIAMLDIVRKKITSGIISGPQLEDIDDLPLYPWHLINQTYYLNLSNETKLATLAFLGSRLSSAKTSSFLTSRGCPFHCTFCHNSLRQVHFRFHSAERIVEEMKRLRVDYGVEAIAFLDENFLLNKTRLEKICRTIRKEKLSVLWSCASSAHFVDAQSVRMIRDAGCRQVSFGVESGSQRILDILNKSVTVEQNKKAIKICREAGLIVHGSFMLGNPTETVEDVKLTQKFILETDIESYRINITTPYPGTKLWELYHEQIPRPIDWHRFEASTNIETYPYTPFSREELKRLFFETSLIKPAIYKRDWKMALRYPKETISWGIRHPLTATRIIAGKYNMRSMQD